MNQKRFTIGYFILSVIFIILENTNSAYPSFIAKALIIPSLMLFYHFSVRGRYETIHRLVMSGLFFSWIGDVVLQLIDLPTELGISQDLLFIGGLCAFLVTHVIYFIGFSLPRGRNTIFRTHIWGLVLVVLYGFIMLYFLYRSLGDMKVPVIAYTLIILVMLTAAINRYGKVNGLSYILVLIGAILFVISDSLIAINKFHMKINFAGVMIMLTYVTAQYLIVRGCIRQTIGVEKQV
jgi:uncharacterized membrane protein YhhN